MDEEAGGFCSPNYLSQREAQGVIKCDGFLSKENHSAKRRKEEPSNNPANLGFFKSRPEDKTNALTHEEFYQMVLEEDKATVEQRFGIDLNEYFDYLCKNSQFLSDTHFSDYSRKIHDLNNSDDYAEFRKFYEEEGKEGISFLQHYMINTS